MTTRVKQTVHVVTDGTAEVQAGLQVEVLDPSNWTPVQLMKRMLGQLDGDRLMALRDLAIQVALLDHPTQKDAADYLGVTPRVCTYHKQRLAAGNLLIEGEGE